MKKKIWPNFQRIIEIFTPKFVTKLSKICVWNPGSGENLFRIPDPFPGVKKAPDPGSGSATLKKIITELDPERYTVLHSLNSLNKKERFLNFLITGTGSIGRKDPEFRPRIVFQFLNDLTRI